MEKGLPPAGGRGPMLIKPETWELLRRLVEEGAIDFDPRDFIQKRTGRRQVISLRPRSPEQGMRGDRAAQYAPLAIRKIVTESVVTWGVKPNHGVLLEIIPRGGEGVDATLEHIPLILPDGAEDPVPHDGSHEIIIAEGDTVFLRYQTDDMGNVKTEAPTGEDPDERPVVMFGSEVPESTHYQPPNPGESEGTEGIYHVALFSISEDAETGAALVEYFVQSDVHHYHEVWKGENVGGGAHVFKQRNIEADTYEFRTPRGNYGITETETEDEIELDFWGENVGGGCPVLVEPDVPLVDGPAQFRSIDERATTPQVRVKCDPPNPGDPLPEVITVEGNSKVGILKARDCTGTLTTLLEWDDGLITTQGEVIIDVGACPDTETEPPP